jgi:hypothetical protein
MTAPSVRKMGWPFRFALVRPNASFLAWPRPTWALSFLLGLSFGITVLRSAPSSASFRSEANLLPADSAFCVNCALLGGGDRGANPGRAADSVEPAIAAIERAFQVPALSTLTRLSPLERERTDFWDPSKPLPGAFDPSSVDPTFRTPYYDPVQGLLDVPSAPWNLFGPASGPALFGGREVLLTGFGLGPLPSWSGGWGISP